MALGAVGAKGALPTHSHTHHTLTAPHQNPTILVLTPQGVDLKEEWQSALKRTTLS